MLLILCGSVGVFMGAKYWCILEGRQVCNAYDPEYYLLGVLVTNHVFRLKRYSYPDIELARMNTLSCASCGFLNALLSLALNSLDSYGMMSTYVRAGIRIPPCAVAYILGPGAVDVNHKLHICIALISDSRRCNC